MSKSVVRKKMKIADLNLEFFVRKHIDEDWVLHLAGLIEAEEKLPPILVNTKGIVIEGRHRIEAHILLNLTEIDVEIHDVNDEVALISMGYKANTGGPKPPSIEDTEHTIMMLLDRGEAQKDIAKLIGLPPSLARKYVGQVKSKLNRLKLTKAAAAIADDNLTLAKAAEKHNVDPEKLREHVSGKRKKHKQGVAEIRKNLSAAYKSMSLKNANLAKKLLEKYEDGDVTAAQVNEFFDKIEDLQKNSAHSIKDWRRRFEAMIPGGQKKSA